MTASFRLLGKRRFLPLFATQFLGDYSNIAIDPGSGDVLAYWTDMRNTACFDGRCGHGEDAFFARVGS